MRDDDGSQDVTGDLRANSVRVRSARRLVTTAPNPALDRLVGLAARLLGVPASQVSLLSDVQTVAAAAGQPHDPTASSPLADALCAVTVSGGGPLIVQDAATDARVSDLLPVTSGAVGAYLGVPLRGQDGSIVGALCVFDPSARTWSDTDVALLSDLAGAAVTELELSALAVDYEASRIRSQLAVAAGGVGTFDWDLITGSLVWDEPLLTMFGYAADDFGRDIEAFNDRLHPDDLPRVADALSRAVQECGQYEAEFRVVRPDGSQRWVQARGQALPDESGRAVRMLGAAYDTTEVRDVDARIARVLESMPTAFYSLDAGWRFSYVNAEAEKLLLRGRAELLGGVVWDLFPATVGTVFETQYRRAVDSSTAVTFEAYHPPPLDGWYEIRAWPSPDGLSVYFVEITDRRRSQRELEEAREDAETARAAAEFARAQAEAAHSAVAAAVDRLRLITSVSEDLTATLDVQEAVARLAQHLVPALADWCIVTLVDENGTLRDVGCEHADPELRTLVRQYRDARLPALSPDSYVFRVWRSSRPISVDADATNALRAVLADGSPAQELIERLAPEAFECLPLRARGRTVGLITLFHADARSHLATDDLLLVTEIADRAGLALDNAQLYSTQHRMAEGLQRSLLTSPVEPDHLQIVVRYQPAAQAAQVGGDWYDAFMTPDRATVLVIGDVMGHDIAAAAGMSQVRSLLRGIAYTTGGGPAQVLSGLDAAMEGLAVDTTATAIVARLEQSDDELERLITRLRWSNAGHPPPVLLDPHGTVTMLAAQPTQLLLGVAPDAHRSDAAITLDRGSTVLMYTDGLIERRDRSLDDGMIALQEAVADLAHASLDELVDGLLARLVPSGHDDDVALVAVRLHRQDRPRPADAGPNRVPAHTPEV